MAGTEHARAAQDRRPDDDDAPAAPTVQTTNRDDEVDALLDEIDDVLETNAETFVRGFVQKGGQ
jgi:ubiquitin-like protein Pup